MEALLYYLRIIVEYISAKVNCPRSQTLFNMVRFYLINGWIFGSGFCLQLVIHLLHPLNPCRLKYLLAQSTFCLSIWSVSKSCDTEKRVFVSFDYRLYSYSIGHNTFTFHLTQSTNVSFSAAITTVDLEHSVLVGHAIIVRDDLFRVTTAFVFYKTDPWFRSYYSVERTYQWV